MLGVVVAIAAVALILVARRLRDPAPKILLPLATAVIFVCGWQIAADERAAAGQQNPAAK